MDDMEYFVTVSCGFEAENAKDAALQMNEWLGHNSNIASYVVEGPKGTLIIELDGR